MKEEAPGPRSALNEWLGAWLPIATAPASGIVLLSVIDAAGERRTFVAELSHERGAFRWQTTTGWIGWGRLHGAWTPTHWMSLPPPPQSA